MRQYRVHYLDPRGKVVGRFEFQCASDREAETVCENLDDPRPKELWSGARWLQAWPAPIRELRRA